MIDALIPARNEADTIGPLVRSLYGKIGGRLNPVNKVIVVDNGSDDETSKMAEAAGAQVVRCDEIGKGQAIARGIGEVTTGSVMLCDGDLTPFKAYHMLVLTTNVMSKGMVIGVPEFTQNVPWAVKGPLWGYLSGVRVVPAEMVTDLRDRDLLYGYTVEVMLNLSAEMRGMRSIRVPLHGVRGKPQWGLPRKEAMRRDYEWMEGKNFRKLLAEKKGES